jgi:hypothetical protein
VSRRAGDGREPARVTGGTAQLWQLTSANTITRLSDGTVAGTTLTVTVPPQSLTLVVFPRGTAPPPDPDPTTVAAPSHLSASVSGTTVTLRWTANAANETHVYIDRKSSARGSTWARVGVVSANVTSYSDAVPKGTYTYRVQAVNTTTSQASAFSNQIQVRVR